MAGVTGPSQAPAIPDNRNTRAASRQMESGVISSIIESHSVLPTGVGKFKTSVSATRAAR